MTNRNPSWVNSNEYPFEPKYFAVPAGRMHYVDEGTGAPVVMVHGNPAWSFLYRHIVKGLRATHRCIVPDHIGFGLSDKPYDWSYLPREHAKNLEALLESLDLRDITLVVGDWGGPIGLSYALAHPDRIKNIVITNTWCWPLNRDWRSIAFSALMGGPIGRWLIREYNVFTKTILPAMFGNKNKLTPEAHRHYMTALQNKKDRKGCWTFPKQIIGSTPWLKELHEKMSALHAKNITIIWGMKDFAFGKKELETWVKLFPAARVVRYEDAGHFLAEESPDQLIADIKSIAGF